MSKTWQVRLGRQAEQDYADIARRTAQHFGPRQAEIYAETLSLAIEALKAGPEVLGAKSRVEIGAGMATLHVARQGRKGRHFVIFRVGGDQISDVLRLLHDSMELKRHVPAANDFSH